MKDSILVYTDGACTQGIGGYGAVVMMAGKKKTFFSQKTFINTTNNRMEARAIVAAVKKIKPGYHINIFTDSQYCQKMFTHCLTFKNVNRLKEFENFDIWSELYWDLDHHKKNGSVMSISWVRAHDGNIYNEEADRLAERGSKQELKQKCQDDVTYNRKKGRYAKQAKQQRKRKFHNKK